MIKTNSFYKTLKKNNINFFTGVPDSLLKNICAYISDISPKNKHIIAANEGGAVGLGIGYNLATGNIPLVYMQNSGLGNAINPLLSLADPDVYSIPMILMVGWRGEPGKKDEPQHIKQGKINEKLIESMDIPYFILSANSNYEKVISESVSIAKDKSCPVILLVKKNTFEKYTLTESGFSKYALTREDAIKGVVEQMNKNDIIVCTTGKASRELFEYRKSIKHNHDCDFLTVGGMGHANQIALAIALEKKNKKVYCFDGDGALIMHAGSLGIIGAQKPKNFKHIIFNNGSHDSVGGQPTIGSEINLRDISLGFQYNNYFRINSHKAIKKTFKEFKNSIGPSFLEIMITKGSRKDLGRPTIAPIDNKKDFNKKMNE
tara:strand:+ start:6292 stop:7416 length:1125 start_codon:yes stop_codon:yes gene_type:complete